MLTRKQVQNSLHKLFVTKEIEALPLDEKCEKWQIRFQYIQLQQYCWYCKKWYDNKFDYCIECGCDFYSHIDLKNNQIAPIRRGRCKSCCITSGCVYGSLNGRLQCEICFYKYKDPSKSHEIELKMKQAIEEVNKSKQNQQLEDFLKKEQKYSIIESMLSGYCLGAPRHQQIKKMIQPWIIEWANHPEIPIEIKRQLKQKVVQKKKDIFKTKGISY